MAKLPIVEFPDERLLTQTEVVASIDDEIKQLVADMLETMYAANGMGLAANQVGALKRIFVMDNSQEKNQPEVFINPEIIESSGEVVLEEGCLSFPGIYVKVKRPEFITLKALNEKGEEIIKSAEYYEARCFLHELDHLNGVTFFDRLSATKRKMALAKFNKLRNK